MLGVEDGDGDLARLWDMLIPHGPVQMLSIN